MKNRSSSRGGFTVMELLIVTIIIAVIAAFAIPSYEKAMARQKVKQLILTATLIGGAQEIYKAKNGRYWCDFTSPCATMVLDGDTSDINTNLGVHIIPESAVSYVTYAVTGSEDKFFRIIITDGISFALGFDSQTSSNITCTNLSATPVCP